MVMPSRALQDTAVTVAIVRSSSGLGLLQSRRAADFVPPGEKNSSNLASLFEVEWIPVKSRQQPAALVELVGAWERLNRVGSSGGDVLADMLLVLLSTVPSAKEEGGPSRRLDPLPPVRWPTAAHPRGFRGTKHKPPKAPEPLRGDLRPLPGALARTGSLLSDLWPLRTSSLRRLRKLGLDEGGLARLVDCARPPSDPYLTFHHLDVPNRAALPGGFVERLLPSLRGERWEVVRRAAALYQRLDLAHDAPLSLLAARALQVSRQKTLQWLEALEEQPRDRRVSFLALVLETGILQSGARLEPDLSTDLARAPKAVYERWVYVTLDGLRRAINPRYLAAGIHLAGEYAPDEGFHRVWDAADFDEETADQLVRLLPVEWAGSELMDLWETCASLPGFSSYLRKSDWTRFTPAQRQFLLRFFMLMRWDRDGPFDQERWRAIATYIPRLERRMQDVPESYTDQYLIDIGSVLSGMKKPAEIRDRLPLAIDLLARVNRPPFNPQGDAARSLGNLLKLPAPDRELILTASETSFLALDKACRRSNAATLIAWGLSSLVDGMPGLVSDAFRSATGALVRTARRLGVLSWPARTQLVRRLSDTALFRQSLDQASLHELVSTIEATGVADAVAVVPRALREHRAGRRPLSAGQLERYATRVRRGLATCRLAALRLAVEGQLTRSVGAQYVDREALSALALLQNAEKNRRGLRRFLRALLSGDTEHLLRHPATQEWARRHPRIDLALWIRGLERRIDSDVGRSAVIRLEQDPFEVLKMGTYVGSCLGMGGGLAYSAAAALLDINKQVLYARNEQGAVIARQLLAISDNDELVPFAVYPESVAPAVQRAFDRYDTELASALGIARVDPTQAYAIENVLSQDWWDDGAWDPGPVQEASPTRRKRTEGAGPR